MVGFPDDEAGIVGGGGAGFAAAEMLRRQNFSGEITILSRDRDAPVDRPNLSKDYLAGSAPEEWIPLRPEEFYGESAIDLRLDTDVMSIDSKQRRVVVAGGETSGAVVNALGVTSLAIGPQIDPGVPWTVSDGARHALALKSGNFGSVDFFEKALAQFDAMAESSR